MIRRRLGRSALRLRRPLLASGRASCLGDAPEWRSMRRFAVGIIGLATRDVCNQTARLCPCARWRRMCDVACTSCVMSYTARTGPGSCPTGSALRVLV